MATTHRSALLRSLPVLLALVLAFFTAPASAGQPSRGPGAHSISASAVAVSTASADLGDTSARTPESPADVPAPLCSTTCAERVLSAQIVPGVAGSRAPPAALA
ncbi:hypothetical protein AB0C07_04975 [Actinoplanes missouriensis]|uniref:hypothetical protein n=1 Tax=Actinoplanes missouriensis TaxID=1866 RepID=UPI0033C1DA74